MNIFPQPKSLTEQAGAFCFGSRVVMHVNWQPFRAQKDAAAQPVEPLQPDRLDAGNR